MSPAEIVISRFGGVRKVGRILGIDHGWVSRWKLPRDSNGASGSVPGVHHKKLLESAKIHGVDLTAEELILGNNASQ